MNPQDGLPTPARTLIAMAEHDLAHAEQVNLATADSADLVRLVESLRGSLFEMIQLARRLSSSSEG